MSRKTTINVPDDLHEKVVAISKYFNKPASYVINQALKVFVANLPRVNYKESTWFIITPDNKK